MTDFLTSLARRVLSDEPEVRPELRPLFAPPPEGEAGRASPRSPAAPSPEWLVIEEASPDAPGDAARQPRGRDRERASEIGRGLRRGPRADAPTRPDAPPRAAYEGHAGLVSAPPNHEEPAAARRSPPPAPPGPEEAHSPRPAVTAAAELIPARPAKELVPARPEVSRPRAAQESPPDLAARRGERAEPGRAATDEAGARRVVRPQTRPAPPVSEASDVRAERVGARPGDQPRRHGEDAAPVVRVSIGRIEVRAVTAPPPAPRPTRPSPSPAPRLTLEEYLRARSRETGR